MGECAARRADHRVEPDAETAETPGLHHYLLSGQDVTEPAERRMPRAGGGPMSPSGLTDLLPDARPTAAGIRSLP